MLASLQWRHDRDDLVVPEPWQFICNIFEGRGGVVDAMLLTPSRTTGNRRLLWRVAKGQCFYPESHPYPHFLHFLQGSGVMCSGGVRFPYFAPRTAVLVEAHVPHYLMAIEHDTVVLQIQPPASGH